jgi:uncharacterized protein YjiS (DUF1127 family)
MRSFARAPSSSRPERISITRRVWHLVVALDLAFEVRRERRMLLRLDDRALKDMGFDRGEAYSEAHRPFWDIPNDRLHS